MPRKTATLNEENDGNISPLNIVDKESELKKLNYMLGAVMKYISDEEISEIDIEYLLDQTEGLRSWWDEFREKDRKKVEAEIKKSLGSLSLEELKKIHEQIIKNENEMTHLK